MARLGAYGGEGNQEERQMLRQVREFLEHHHEGRFAVDGRTGDEHAPKTLQRVGYRGSSDAGTEYYIFRESFKSEVCKGLDYRAVTKLLISRGFMKPGDGKNLCCKVSFAHEGRIRVFHILPTIWSDDD